jgi:hypothetical protein
MKNDFTFALATMFLLAALAYASSGIDSDNFANVFTVQPSFEANPIQWPDNSICHSLGYYELRIGDSIQGEVSGSQYRIQFSDIGTATGPTNMHPGIFGIYSPQSWDQPYGYLQINPRNSTYDYTAPNGDSFSISTCEVDGGFTLAAKYAFINTSLTNITVIRGSYGLPQTLPQNPQNPNSPSPNPQNPNYSSPNSEPSQTPQAQPPEPYTPPNRANLMLYRGWNMVSPSDTGFSLSLISQYCSVVGKAWEYDGKKYQEYFGSNPGHAFWVRVSSDCEVKNEGQPFDIHEISLHTGWNQIGTPNENYAYNAAASTCTVTNGPWLYDTKKRVYAIGSPDGMKSGRGYWFKVSRDCTLSFGGGELPPVPPTDEIAPRDVKILMQGERLQFGDDIFLRFDAAVPPRGLQSKWVADFTLMDANETYLFPTPYVDWLRTYTFAIADGGNATIRYMGEEYMVKIYHVQKCITLGCDWVNVSISKLVQTTCENQTRLNWVWESSSEGVGVHLGEVRGDGSVKITLYQYHNRIPIKQFWLGPGETDTETINGTEYNIRVYQTLNGSGRPFEVDSSGVGRYMKLAELWFSACN